MILDDEHLIDEILEREGGYVNRADDAGGPTKYGITLETLESWRKRQGLTAADVEALDVLEAREIYRYRYIGAPGFGKIVDPAIRALLVDCGVLHGTRNGVRFLQRALRVADDGVFGDQTLAALWRVDRKKLWHEIFAERLRFLGRCISDNLTDADRDGIPDSTEHAKGWLNRFADLLKEAPL